VLLFVSSCRRRAWREPLADSDRLQLEVVSNSQAVVGDPRFVGSGGRVGGTPAGAFRLRRDSPAIGAGVLLPGAPSYDFFGTRVPRDAPPTIGFAQAWPPAR